MGSNVNAAGVATNMPTFVRQIQRERMGRSATSPSQQPAADPQQFQQLLNKVSPMPPQLLEHFKKKEAKNEDGSEMSDKEKRKAALDKVRKYQERKKDNKDGK
jgi:hypothetical protein